MPRKLFFMAVLLLLVSVQALAANCDLRCSLMRSSMVNHTSQMPDCQGMTMQRSNAQRAQGTSLTPDSSCAHNGCGIGLNSINKSSDQDYANSGTLLRSAVALFIDPSGSSGPDRASSHASLSPGSDSRPLAQRPGSSLRI
jgi:hypothetical protein